MPTISGTLLLGSGAPALNAYIRVRMANPPHDGAGIVRASEPEVFVTSATTGGYSFVLSQGSYLVNVRGTPEFQITVPAAGGPYTLSEAAILTDSELQTQILAWALAEAFSLSSLVYDLNGVISTASVTWPDGKTGHYATTVFNSLFSVPDAFTVTYEASAATFTVTQPQVTRNADGTITNQPPMTIV